jgi:RimK-like ATP-grasp domain
LRATCPETILIWGIPQDPPTASVREVLEQIGCPVVFLDQRAVCDTAVELVVGAAVDGLLRAGSETINLASVKSAYLRPYDSRKMPIVASAGRNSEVWRHALEVEDILMSWCDLTPALVLNRPSDAAANSSKPYQASWIESFGFLIPDTLITTDPDVALKFWQQHGRVIYKSVSASRSTVSCLTPEHRQRFNSITSCPTQFQQYVPGTEYRVHVVGEEVFACAVISDADDYRVANAHVDMYPCGLPSDLADQCKTLARSMNLLLAGLDLRCTPDGDWYCFEVNPSPAFTFFQQVTGQPIAESVAQLLASGGENVACHPQSLPLESNEDLISWKAVKQRPFVHTNRAA